MVKTRKGHAITHAPAHRKMPEPLEFHDAYSALYRQLKPQRLKLLDISKFLEEQDIKRGDKEDWCELKCDLRKRRHQYDYVRKFRKGGEFVSQPRRQGEYDIFTEARAYFDELIGILATAAVERINLSSTNGEILQDLKWTKRYPREFLVYRSKVSVLVATHIARNYQRTVEPPGTGWYDLEWVAQQPPSGVQHAVAERVSEAAGRAEEGIRVQTNNSRRRKALTPSMEALANGLRQWLMRFGHPKPIPKFETSSADPLLDIVLAPLNGLIESHHGHPFRRKYLVKLICQAL